MIEIHGFKHMTAAGAERFMTYVAEDGTIGVMFDLTEEALLELLIGQPDLPKFDDDEQACEYYDELEAFRYMLCLASSLMANNMHTCLRHHHASTEKPCICGMGFSVLNMQE